MKKVHTIHLNQVIFHIEEDAYQRLQLYIESAKQELQKEGDLDAIKELEGKLAFYLSRFVDSQKQVITMDDVEKVFELLTNGDSSYSNNHDEARTNSRRLYRDLDQGIVAGICAGISRYFGWDVTWVRIILVLLMLFSLGNILIIYLILWFVIPKPITEQDRRKMENGEGRMNAEHLKQEVEHMREYVSSEHFRSSVSKSAHKLFVFFEPAIRFFAGFIGVIAGITAIAFVFALLVVVFAFFFRPDLFHVIGITNVHQFFVLNSYETWWFFSSLILMGLGSLLTIIFIISFLVKGKLNKGLGKLLFAVLILWLMGLILYFTYSGNNLQWMSHMKQSSMVDYESHEQMTDVRECGAFHSIEVESTIDLVLIQDSVEEVKVIAPEKVQSRLVTKVDDGVLKIYSRGVFFQNVATVYVKVKDVHFIQLSGVSSITSQNTLKVQNLELILSGSGEANLSMEVANMLDVKASGATDLQLLGTAKNMNVILSGTSSLNARGMKIENVQVETSGVSDARIFAIKTIKAYASGASEIECIGNPQVKEKAQQAGAEIRIR